MAVAFVDDQMCAAVDSSSDQEVEAFSSSSDIETQLLPAGTGVDFRKVRARPLLLMSVAVAALLGLAALAWVAEEADVADVAADVAATVVDAEEDKEGMRDENFNHKPAHDDSKNVMPKEEAEKLDIAVKGLDEFPGFLPMVPILYPEEAEAHDSKIADKLKKLKDRDASIQLPDGTKVPYWQTLQYANRHFRIYFTRFEEGMQGKKEFETIPFEERTRVWAMSSLLRKILAHPDFLKWTEDSKFEGFTGEEVYESFEKASEGQFVRTWDIPGRAKIAVANGKGITFDSVKADLATKKLSHLMSTYAHESSHNLGYGHETQVPYPIGRWIKSHGLGITDYEVYDLAETPDFEIEQ